MKTVPLGSSGIVVSEVGFGGIPIMPLSSMEAVAIVRHCFDVGMTLFDTANMYHTSEDKIGTALKGVRDKVVLATKTTMKDAKGAFAHLELSLTQLKTDWIDIYQLHNVSNKEALQKVLAPLGAYEAAHKARHAGKIRCIGITSHSIPIAMQALKTGLFQTVQIPFNFIENDPVDELLPLARENGVGIIGMKPLGGGLLGRADLCFRYLQQHPDVVPIPGIRSAQEADEITGLYRDPLPLSDAESKAIEHIRSTLGRKFCHRCEYCMPCEQGVQISSVLIFEAAAIRLSRSGVSSWVGKAMESAADCLECGECEQKCPYNLPIIDLLKENLALYQEFIR